MVISLCLLVQLLEDEFLFLQKLKLLNWSSLFSRRMCNGLMFHSIKNSYAITLIELAGFFQKFWLLTLPPFFFLFLEKYCKKIKNRQKNFKMYFYIYIYIYIFFSKHKIFLPCRKVSPGICHSDIQFVQSSVLLSFSYLYFIALICFCQADESHLPVVTTVNYTVTPSQSIYFLINGSHLHTSSNLGLRCFLNLLKYFSQSYLSFQ